MSALVRAILIVAFACLPLTSALADRRVALIVANAAYTDAPLQNPPIDASIVEQSLERIGFAVTVVRDADLRTFDAAVNNFTDLARNADVALFYYAGHGFAVNEGIKPVSVLMATNADLTSNSERILRSGGIPLDDIVGELAGRAKATLIFVDACRNDPRLSRSLGGRGRGLSPIESVSGANLYIGISTRLGETASDGDAGRGSPFARAFAVAIQTKGLRIDDAFRMLRDRVRSETGGKQNPDVVEDDLPNGSITLVSPDGATPAAAPSPAVTPVPAPTVASLAPIQPPIAPPMLFSGGIKIGVAGPISGPNAPFGAQLTRGVAQAAEDINKAGGILGQKVVVEQGDDASDPKQGVSVANKFVGDGVHFVVGHFNSGVTIPASKVYADNGVLMITPSATNPKVTNPGLWDVFRTCGRDDQQGKLWADLALSSKYRNAKIAIVHDKTTYGQGLADAAKGFMNAGGKREVLYEGVDAGEKDYSDIVAKIKATGADYLFWGGLHTEGGLIVRQMRDQGMKTVMISGDGITDNDFASIGGPGVEGTLMSFGPEPRNNPNAGAVVAEFRAKNFEPQAYTLYSYAAVQIMKEAAEKTRSLDPKKMAEYMHSGVTFKTVIGDIAYDKKGDRISLDYVWYVWKRNNSGQITYFQQQL